MKRIVLSLALVLLLAHGIFAGEVAAFETNSMFESGNPFDPLEAVSGISNLSYSAGDGINCAKYYDGAVIDDMTTLSGMADALAAGSYVEFSFQTSAVGQVTAFDTFYMGNETIVEVNEGVASFEMGLAFDNGSGSFLQTIAGIDPQDIAGGIDISGFNAVSSNSTARFRVVFYNDTRGGLGSALYPENATRGGVSDAAVVFTGTVSVPEPATIALLAAGGVALLRRKQ